ncbi:MAG TPA: chromosomal replication initiator protein DnaA [Nitrospinota bacterium]|nr:chromosomal replication initiator protein DnaA [Nitrospinota bacterium]
MENLWNNCLKEIKKSLPPQVYEAWFLPISIISFYKEKATIEVPSKFHKEWLASKYQPLLEETLCKICGSNISIDLTISNTKKSPSKDTNKSKDISPLIEKVEEEISKTNYDRHGLNKMYIFDNFITGTSNQFAHAAAYAVAEAPSKAYNPLFIYGGVGLGKTHLIHAIGHHILKKDKRKKICYVSSERFLTNLISAIKQQKTEGFRKLYRSVDILLMDDIQFLAGKEKSQEEFFHTFNTLFESEKQIVIASDRFPKYIPKLEERLVSRFQWGLIADIKPPEYETKMAILKKKADTFNFKLPDDVAGYIAKKIFSSVRELEGALIRIIAYSSLINRSITLGMAEEVLKDLFYEKEKIITIKLIQKEVSSFFHLKTSDLKSKNRNRAVVSARHLAMFLCRELTDTSLPEIGKNFGGKDHTSVIHACKKINSQLKSNPDTAHNIKQLKDIISG